MPLDDPWREAIEILDRDCPFIPHTDACRLFSTVRRMKAERALGMPFGRRSGFAFSIATGRHTAAMDEAAWEAFYQAIRADLARRVWPSPGFKQARSSDIAKCADFGTFRPWPDVRFESFEVGVGT